MAASWFLALASAALPSAEAPRHVVAPISALKIDGKLPEIAANPWGAEESVWLGANAARWGAFGGPASLPLRAEIPGGVAEVLIADAPVAAVWSDAFVVAQLPAGVAARGNLWLRVSTREGTVVKKVAFAFPEQPSATRAEAWFAFARAKRLERLANAPAVGAVAAAWLSREAQRVPPAAAALAALWKAPSGLRDTPAAAGQALGFQPETHEPNPARFAGLVTAANNRNAARPRSTDDPIGFLTGGRAIEENLQADRAIAAAETTPPAPGEAAKQPDVPLRDLPGIDIAAIDWKEQLKGKNPALDPLAAFVPHDQHAVFFPMAAALAATLEELESTGFGVLQTTGEHAADDGRCQAYREQLGLPSRQWLQLLPPALATAFAVTGSDLNFGLGTDLAVLIASPKPDALAAAIRTVWATTGTAVKEETHAGAKCQVLRTPDRRLSAYLVELPGAVLLANSPVQVAAAVETHAGKRPALAGLDEYKFFRDRYPRGDAAETGFAILTDAAIRRWCGPQWRIAQSRRLAARGALADAQAEWFDTILRGAALPAARAPGNAPRIDFNDAGAWSPELGTVRFQTPIAELSFAAATHAEAEAYRRWREGYQRNWSRVFDPIAVRFSVAAGRLATDVSVMPLIVGSEYRRDLFLANDAPLPPGAGDPHPEAVVQWVAGLDPNRLANDNRGGWLDRPFGPERAVSSWLGNWFTIYADADPFWEEPLWREVKKARWFEEKLLQNLHRMPVGVAVGVRSPLSLAGFLTAARGQLETAAPNLASFQPRRHREVGYTAIVSERGVIDAKLSLYYLTLPDQLLISFHEGLIQRAIDRHLARKEGKGPPPKDWLGNTFAAEGSAAALRMLATLGSDQAVPRMQATAWANAELLAEWRRLRPTEDPLALHLRGAGERLLCPAGGTFAWDAAANAMASSALGSPFAPKDDLSGPTALLGRLVRVAGGFTLSDNNLRARAELIREPAAAPEKK